MSNLKIDLLFLFQLLPDNLFVFMHILGGECICTSLMVSLATNLSMRKHFLTVRVTELWHRLPRELMESPSLEIFKSCLNLFLGNCLCVALLEQGDWTR